MNNPLERFFVEAEKHQGNIFSLKLLQKYLSTSSKRRKDESHEAIDCYSHACNNIKTILRSLFNFSAFLAKAATEKSERQVHFPQADRPTKMPQRFLLNRKRASSSRSYKSPHTCHRPFLWLHFHHFYFFVR